MNVNTRLMTYSADDSGSTLTPKHIMETYRRAYKQVHGQEPHIAHQFAEWYQVNGETVHRVTLFGEISRLRGLAQQQRLTAENTDKSLIQRLINKLRRV
jgi:replication initiation and membrane attachment protein DnaB